MSRLELTHVSFASSVRSKGVRCAPMTFSFELVPWCSSLFGSRDRLFALKSSKCLRCSKQVSDCPDRLHASHASSSYNHVHLRFRSTQLVHEVLGDSLGCHARVSSLILFDGLCPVLAADFFLDMTDRTRRRCGAYLGRSHMRMKQR